MIDFAAARRMMVDGQVRTADITDLRLLAAMGDVPRERFVPESKAELAYLDQDLPVSDGDGRRKLLKPMVLAKLIQLAEIGDTDHVRMAEQALAGVSNVTVVVGPLVTGWPIAEPYDVIIMQGATEVAPDALLAQLKDGGRLVCVLGPGPQRKATIYRKIDGDVSGRPAFDAAAPLLPGFKRAPAFVF